jgi:hypothetical protein
LLAAPQDGGHLIVGDLDGYDASTNTITVRTTDGEVRLPIAPGASLHEGAHILDGPAKLQPFRGHNSKITTSDDGRVVRIMVSPEKVLKGTLEGYDRGVVQFAGTDGQHALPVTIDTWVHVGNGTIEPTTLPRYAGRTAKITVSLRTGQLLSVWVSDKPEPGAVATSGHEK